MYEACDSLGAEALNDGCEEIEPVKEGKGHLGLVSAD